VPRSWSPCRWPAHSAGHGPRPAHIVQSRSCLHPETRVVRARRACAGRGPPTAAPSSGTGVVHDQHRVRIIETLDDVLTHVAQNLVCVPAVPVQRPVDPVRTRMLGLLRQCPAVLRTSGAISPRIYASADSRDSDLAKRCTNRSCKTSVHPTTTGRQQVPHPRADQRPTCPTVTTKTVAVLG
jgi:hypothetical protein